MVSPYDGGDTWHRLHHRYHGPSPPPEDKLRSVKVRLGKAELSEDACLAYLALLGLCREVLPGTVAEVTGLSNLEARWALFTLAEDDQFASRRDEHFTGHLPPPPPHQSSIQYRMLYNDLVAITDGRTPIKDDQGWILPRLDFGQADAVYQGAGK